MEKTKLVLLDEAAQLVAQEAQTGEAMREEPLPIASRRCLRQSTRSSCRQCCVREAAGSKGKSDFQHGKFPCLHLPEMKNTGCLGSNCLWAFKLSSCSSSVQLGLSLLPTAWGGRGRGRPTHPWGTPAEILPRTDPPSHLAWPPRHCPCTSPYLIVSLGVLIFSDICLKRSSMSSQSCSVPPAHFGYEITALGPWDLCHVAIDREKIVLTDYAVQRPFCQARFVKLLVPVPQNTKAI